jgi:hypothetical protein
MKFTLTLLAVAITFIAQAKPPKQEFYEIRIYQLANADQEKRVDAY